MQETTLTPNKIGGLHDPINISIMDVPEFIHMKRAMPVTSSLIFEPSTTMYHPEGLYSEEIFGPVGSPERMLKFGFIELNTDIFHPKIFKILSQLKGLYKDIMHGTAYAIFDPVKKDFERVVGDPFETEGADTGFTFFMNHFHDIQFPRTSSSTRDERIEVIEMYRDFDIINRHLVEPAGVRDIANDSSGRLIQDEVNKLYTSLLLYTRSIPKGSTSPLYDPVRYQIQSKAQEIFEYIENFLDGKRGFIQGNFTRRHVAGGTRNVITAASFIASSPEDPQLLKADDVMVGVFQTLKGMTPHANYAFRMIFGNPILKAESTTKVALTDPKTGKLVYTTIDYATRDKWMTSNGLEDIFNSFRNTNLRSNPVLLRDTDGKDYAFIMVYDEGDEIALCRSIDDLEAAWPRKIDKKKLRPITYIEMFYIIAEIITQGKHGVVTRYPVIEQGSSYVAEIHVVSTTPSRTVELVDLISNGEHSTLLKQYPVLGASYMDAMMVHPSKLAALGGDHDGDKCSLEYLWRDDVNHECAAYLASPASVINTDLRFITGGSNYLIDLMLHNLTKRA